MENIQTQAPQDTLMDSLLGLGAVPEPVQEVTEVADIEVHTPEVVTPEPVPAVETKAEVAPATPAEKAPEPSVDPLEAYLNEGQQTEPEWPKEILERFKGELGFDSPAAIKQHIATLSEQTEQLKTKAQEAEAIRQRIDEFPLELQNAINRQLQGEDGVAYLQSLRQGVSLSKEAKDIAQEKLVEAYFPGKFTPEQLESIREGDETLKAAHERFAELAAMEHNAQRTKELGRVEAQQKAYTMQREAREASKAAAVAAFKQNKSLSALVDNAFVSKFQSGQLETELLYNEDGTYRPEALARLAMIGLHDKLVERARAGARTEAKNEALLEATARLPQTPKPGPSERIPAPQLTDEQKRLQSVEDSLFAAMAPR